LEESILDAPAVNNTSRPMFEKAAVLRDPLTNVNLNLLSHALLAYSKDMNSIPNSPEELIVQS
jgi:hypothetical protein